jgi:hypothetical protein
MAASSQALGSSNALKVTPDNTDRFCFPMFKAALEFYGLPVNYIRTFQRHPLVDKVTGLLMIGKEYGTHQQFYSRNCR